jgi:hypothetical protein
LITLFEELLELWLLKVSWVTVWTALGVPSLS